MSAAGRFARFVPRASLPSALIALALVGLTALPAHAAAGDLDPTFGSGGIVVTTMPNKGWANQIAIQPDGKLVVGGFNGVKPVTDFAVVRYNTDGSLDTTFGPNHTGIVTTDLAGGYDVARATILLSDGKILLGGLATVGTNQDLAMARYNPDGTLDTTFGTGGKVTTDIGGTDTIRALLIRPSDGKIIAAGFCGSTGHFDFCLARYRPDGSLDTTFGTGGKVTTDFGLVDEGRGAVLQPGGKIVVGGFSKLNNSASDFVLARYNPNGSLDPTFGTGGKVTTDLGAYDVIRAIALRSDGKIVAGGYSGCCGGGLATVAGTIDPDLAEDGLGQATPSDFALARYNTDGSLDSTFGVGGKVVTDLFGNADHARGLALQSDGKVVMSGNSATLTSPSVDHFATVRWNTNGSLDSSFGIGGIVLVSMGAGQQGARDVKIQTDGNIVSAGILSAGGGGFEFALNRLLGG